MSARVYTGAATPTTLSGSITNVSTSGTITIATNWLTSGQFSIVVDPGLAGEEKILCTLSGTTLTFITRGYDGTTAASHNSGAVVYPVPTAIDFSEANTHVNASSAVHGLAGSVVGTTDTQTLTNKDLSSSTNTFPASTPAGKNAVINGGMDIWQRGTSFTNPTSTLSSYIADRWNIYRSGFTAGITATRQSSGLTGFQYNVRVQRNSGDTSTATLSLQQSLETATSVPLANQSVTISFYARAGANYSATSNQLVFTVTTGTGTDQSFVGGYTGSVTPINSTATLTTSWQRFSATASLSSATNEISVGFFANPVGTAGANDYYEITGVQLELGSTATTFSRAGGSIGGELALCQRYYQRFSFAASNLSGGFGTAATTTSAIILFPRSVSMRVTPTSIENSTLAVYDGTTPPQPVTLTNGSTFPDSLVVTASGSGLTAFRPYFILGGSGASYVGFTAEL